MHPQAEKVAAYANATMCLRTAELSAVYYYQSLPLCVIDAVFSIGVLYGQVENVIRHFSRVTGWTTFRELHSGFPPANSQASISDFLQVATQHAHPEESLFNNRGYANPTSRQNRIRKAILVQEFARVLQEEKVETFQFLESHPDQARLDRKLRALPASSSGVAVRYFRMLAGDDDQVKPDRMILRFIEDCIGNMMGPDEAATIIQDACALLKKVHPHLTPRLLDFEIWKHQRDKPSPRGGLPKRANCCDGH